MIGTHHPGEFRDGRNGTTASLFLAMGGMGLRDVSRTSQPIYWASWADCFSIVKDRHPDVATMIVRQLSGEDVCESPSFRQRPEPFGSWQERKFSRLLHGRRWRMGLDHQPTKWTISRQGTGGSTRQVSRVERFIRNHLMGRVAEHEQALLHSQSGVMVGMAVSVNSSSFFTCSDPPSFVQRSFVAPVRQCRCGRPFESLGHYRVACARAEGVRKKLRVLPPGCAAKEKVWRRATCH